MLRIISLPVFPNEEAWNNHNHDGGGDDVAHRLPRTVYALDIATWQSLHQAYKADSLILPIL